MLRKLAYYAMPAVCLPLLGSALWWLFPEERLCAVLLAAGGLVGMLYAMGLIDGGERWRS